MKQILAVLVLMASACAQKIDLATQTKGTLPPGRLITGTLVGNMCLRTSLDATQITISVPCITAAADNAFSGNNAFSGTNTHSGTETFTGNNTFSGADTHSGSETFTGAVSAKSVNGVLNASLFSGSDMAAKINAAIASLSGSCGRIMVPTGTYNVTTQLVKPKCVVIDLGGSVLNFATSALPAVISGDAGVSTAFTMGGIVNGTLNGSGRATSAIGVWLGGDGNAANAPANYSDWLESFTNLTVQNFGSGYYVGYKAFQIMWVGGIIQQCTWGIQNANQYYSENMNLHGTQIFNNVGNGIVVDAQSDFHLYGVSLDYNQGGGIQLQSGGISMQGGNIEQLSGLAINSPAGVNGLVVGLYNVRLALTNASGSDASFLNIGGTNSNLTAQGVHLIHLHTVTEFVNWQSLGSVNAAFIDFHDDSTTSILATQASPNIQTLTVSAPWLGTFINPLVTHKVLQNTAGQFAGVSACVTSTKAITFPVAYGSAPAIVVFDETTKGGANLSAKSASGFTVSCTGATDAFSWVAVGNPN